MGEKAKLPSTIFRMMGKIVRAYTWSARSELKVNNQRTTRLNNAKRYHLYGRKDDMENE